MEHKETVYTLLKAALWGADRFPIPQDAEADWQAAYEELRAHTVAGLVVDTLPLLSGLEPGLRQSWIQNSSRNMMFWHKLMGTQQELCDRLRDAGIPFAVLKGAAANLYYPQPEYRNMGDIDLIVPQEEFEKAVSVVYAEGWQLIGDSERHMELKKDGVILELHRYFASSGDEAAAKTLDGLIFDVLDRAEPATIAQYRFTMLPKLENGLVLLAHIAQHLRSGLGLRQIVDWMMFAERELDDAYWSETFRPWVRATGMETLAITVTRMCQLYLGLREDGITWCIGADEALCAELMDVTMARGNFGRKLGDYSTMVNVLGRFSGVGTLLRGLQMRGEYNWKTLQKRPWLRPFAWVYQICRYIRRGLARKNPFHQLSANVRQVKRENLLWENLGVTKHREATQFQLNDDEKN